MAEEDKSALQANQDAADYDTAYDENGEPVYNADGEPLIQIKKELKELKLLPLTPMYNYIYSTDF